MSVSDSATLVLSATGSTSGRTKQNDICSGPYSSTIVFLRNTCEKSGVCNSWEDICQRYLASSKTTVKLIDPQCAVKLTHDALTIIYVNRSANTFIYVLVATLYYHIYTPSKFTLTRSNFCFPSDHYHKNLPYITWTLNIWFTWELTVILTPGF